MTEEGVVGGGSVQGPTLAPKKRRILADVFDLLIVPFVLGIVAALVLIAAPETIRNIVLIFVNVAWMIFRDTVYSPGRKMCDLKLVSLAGGKVTVPQAFVRNILLIIPFVLIIGYVVELVMVLTTGERLEDRWAKTKVTVG